MRRDAALQILHRLSAAKVPQVDPDSNKAPADDLNKKP
jgi:outer membrane lipopolysaccharide assembly protein LptE/RlpB